jgi:hypothetical protein
VGEKQKKKVKEDLQETTGSAGDEDIAIVTSGCRERVEGCPIAWGQPKPAHRRSPSAPAA